MLTDQLEKRSFYFPRIIKSLFYSDEGLIDKDAYLGR